MVNKRRRYDEKSGMAAGVDYLLRQQGRLDTNPSISAAGPSGATGTKNPIEPTYLVAASDARTAIRNVADFRCDGTADQVELSDAAALLPDGGRIVLTEGTYFLSDVWSAPDHISIEGLGKYTTLIKNAVGSFASDAAMINFGTGTAEIRDLSIYMDGGGGKFEAFQALSADELHIESCYIQSYSTTNGNYLITAGQVGMRDCDLWGDIGGYTGSASGRDRIVGNTFFCGDNTHEVITTPSDQAYIAGNRIAAQGTAPAVYLPVAHNASVVDNVISGTGRVIRSNSSDKVTVRGNQITAAVGVASQGVIDINSGVGHRIIGNEIDGPTTLGDAIRFAGSDSVIALNVIVTPAVDGIYISGDKNIIIGNRIDTPGGDGIELTGTADGNLLNSNLIDGAGGSSINNGGTNTIYEDDVDSLIWSMSQTLTVKTGLLEIPFGVSAEIIEIEARLSIQPTGTSVIVDVNKNGTTMYTTQASRPTIATSTNTDTTTPDITAIADNDYLSVDVDQIDSNAIGQNLTVTIRFRRT